MSKLFKLKRLLKFSCSNFHNKIVMSLSWPGEKCYSLEGEGPPQARVWTLGPNLWCFSRGCGAFQSWDLSVGVCHCRLGLEDNNSPLLLLWKLWEYISHEIVTHHTTSSHCPVSNLCNHHAFTSMVEYILRFMSQLNSYMSYYSLVFCHSTEKDN